MSEARRVSMSQVVYFGSVFPWHRTPRRHQLALREGLASLSRHCVVHKHIPLATRLIPLWQDAPSERAQEETGLSNFLRCSACKTSAHSVLSKTEARRSHTSRSGPCNWKVAAWDPRPGLSASLSRVGVSPALDSRCTRKEQDLGGDTPGSRGGLSCATCCSNCDSEMIASLDKIRG